MIVSNRRAGGPHKKVNYPEFLPFGISVGQFFEHPA